MGKNKDFDYDEYEDDAFDFADFAGPTGFDIADERLIAAAAPYFERAAQQARESDFIAESKSAAHEISRELLSFFNSLKVNYGFKFGISEIQTAITSISDMTDVEDVLYTTQSCLCKTPEQCKVYEAQFCQRFLKYRKDPKPTDAAQNKSSKNSQAQESAADLLARLTVFKNRAQKSKSAYDTAAGEYEKKKSELDKKSSEHEKIKAESEKTAKNYEGQKKSAFKNTEEYKKAKKLAQQIIDQCKSKDKNAPLIAFFGKSSSEFERKLKSDDKIDVKQAQRLAMTAAVAARNVNNAECFRQLTQLAAKISEIISNLEKAEKKTSNLTEVQKAKRQAEEKQFAFSKIDMELERAKSSFDTANQNQKKLQQRFESEQDNVTRLDRKYTEALEKEETQRLIQKEQAENHRALFVGGHNAVQTEHDSLKVLESPISTLAKADMDVIQSYIRTNARLFKQTLRAKHKCSNHHHIDVKETIRRTSQTDGNIAKIYWEKPKKSKARVVVLTDISGSCRAASTLTMSFMALMAETFPGGCHQFVFVNDLHCVDEYFRQQTIDAAIQSIGQNIQSRGVYSNYGTPIKQLREDYAGLISRDTTVIILGDARNNANNPQLDSLRWICEHAKQTFLLNPDKKEKWNTGDSIVSEYEACGVKSYYINNAKTLLEFLQSA